MSLNAQRNLDTSQSSLATSMQRLSSGLRVNSAKDDAAGLAICRAHERPGARPERRGAQRQRRHLAGADRRRRAGQGRRHAAAHARTGRAVGQRHQQRRPTATPCRPKCSAAARRNRPRRQDRPSFNGTKLLDGSFTAASLPGRRQRRREHHGRLDRRRHARPTLGSIDLRSAPATVAANAAITGFGTAIAAGTLTIDGRAARRRHRRHRRRGAVPRARRARWSRRSTASPATTGVSAYLVDGADRSRSRLRTAAVEHRRGRHRRLGATARPASPAPAAHRRCRCRHRPASPTLDVDDRRRAPRSR